MSEKKRLSLTVDTDTAEFLRSRQNTSAFVNKMVNRVREGYDPEAVIIDYRIEEEKAQLARLESQIEAIETTIDELENRKERYKGYKKKKAVEFVETVSERVPADPDNPAIQNWAEKADTDPETFANWVREVRSE